MEWQRARRGGGSPLAVRYINAAELAASGTERHGTARGTDSGGDDASPRVALSLFRPSPFRKHRRFFSRVTPESSSRMKRTNDDDDDATFFSG